MENFEENNVKERVEKKFNRYGSEEIERHQKILATYSKVLLTDDRVITKYQICTYNNSIYDPMGPDSHRESSLNLSLKNVNRETFDYYLKYLRSKKSMYLTRANRSFINA